MTDGGLSYTPKIVIFVYTSFCDDKFPSNSTLQLQEYIDKIQNPRYLILHLSHREHLTEIIHCTRLPLDYLLKRLLPIPSIS